MTVSRIHTLAYSIFGKSITQKSAEYIDLQQKLVHARIGIPFDVYIATACLFSVMAALPLGGAAYLLFIERFNAILGDASIIIVPVLSIFFGFMVYNMWLAYPGIMANLRGRKIDISLPHAVALMHALSRGSSNIISLFELIGRNKNIYGEVSEDARGILLDVKMFNQDILNALKNAAMRTPSESFRNLVEGLTTVITSGGDLVSFFLSKSEQYRLKALNENKSFMEMLGLLSEVYVTGFAAGPLFIITLLVVLGVLGGENFFILNIVVYLLIPGGALMFIVLLSSITKGNESEFIEIPRLKRQEEDINFQIAETRFQVYQFMQNPLLRLIEKPETILYLSVPFAILFFVASTYKFYGLEFDKLIYEVDDYLIFTTLIMFIPYSVFLEIRSSRIRRMAKSFPDFLNRLMSLHESGLTLAKSLRQLRSSDLGILNSEIKKMNADVEWNGNVVVAFKNFGERVRTLGILRVVTLIESASHMTGNIKDTLAIAATDALTNRTLEDERRSAMRIQIIIIYVSFFIFLYVAYSLVSGFLPQLPELSPGGGAEVTGIIGEGIAFSGIDKPLYVRLFFHASILVGFFSGLVAGQIGEGDTRLGLKHSIAMIAIAYTLFMLVT